MATLQSQKRLTKEYKAIQANPPPYIVAKPNDENILEWHYVISGPPETPYEGGQYHGLLRFPHEYPFKPPSIQMITPNGRFATNQGLCLSMSDFHPDLWNPAWSVSTILTGLLLFMTGNENTTGLIDTSDAAKRKFAANSVRWNTEENSRFVKQFPGLVTENMGVLAKRREMETSRQKSEAINSELKEDENERKAKMLEQLDPEDRVRMMQQDEGGEGFSVGRATVVVVFCAVLAAFLYNR